MQRFRTMKYSIPGTRNSAQYSGNSIHYDDQ